MVDATRCLLIIIIIVCGLSTTTTTTSRSHFGILHVVTINAYLTAQQQKRWTKVSPRSTSIERIDFICDRQISYNRMISLRGSDEDVNESSIGTIQTPVELSNNEIVVVSSLNDNFMKTNKSSSSKKNTGGVYVRPSAAIERGSGFFVPGLEGYKVRLFVGSIVVVATVLLHFYHSTSTIPISGGGSSSSIITSGGNIFAESLAIFYGLLVLLQGTIEARKDLLLPQWTNYQSSSSSSSSRSTGNVQIYQQQWSIEKSSPTTEWYDKVEWVASTYLSLTSATNMILIGPGKIIFSLGTAVRPDISKNDDDESKGCIGALSTLAQSTSGRLSLPLNHITVQTLFPSSSLETEQQQQIIKSVVLQRINDQLCWMMISNQLLVSFTSYDLQWLGQLAQYTDPE